MYNSILFFALSFFFSLQAFAQSSPDALRVIEAYQGATAINDLRSELTYTNISKTGRQQQRSLKQAILRNQAGKNTYNLLLEFTAPGDVAGTATLTLQNANQEDDQWLYLPVLRTSRRISASAKADRFMGTEMTYEDLSTYLAEPQEEYTYRLLGEENTGGRTAYKLEATPVAGTLTQYSRREMWIDKATSLMLRTDFYDKKGTLLKRYTATDIRKVGGNFYRAHQIELVNHQSGNRTEVIYTDFVINQGVDASLFSKTYLETK
jgi:outer membrane lipoprotein-sorting protein